MIVSTLWADQRPACSDLRAAATTAGAATGATGAVAATATATATAAAAAGEQQRTFLSLFLPLTSASQLLNQITSLFHFPTFGSSFTEDFPKQLPNTIGRIVLGRVKGDGPGKGWCQKGSSLKGCHVRVSHHYTMNHQPLKTSAC